MNNGQGETIIEYIKRINLVLDFIDKNLASNLSLESLSKKAHYSPFHFHRVFATILGENLNQYVNRKRVETIASILMDGSTKSIKELSYFYGFKSENSFSRTFKKYYGITPTKFKTEGKNTLSKIGIEPFAAKEYICSIDQINQWIKMNSKIIVTELQEQKLAGIAQIGTFGKMNAAFQRLMKWGHDKGVLDLSNFKAITIYHDNPNVSQMSKVRFSACVPIIKDIEAEEDIRPITIRKGIYVIGRFEIKGEDISKAWKNLCICVIEKGYEFRDGDYFEVYHNDSKSHPEQKFNVDICIPIQKTDIVELDKELIVNFSNSKESANQSKINVNYHQLIDFMKELKAYFKKEYALEYKIGNLYQGSKDYTYFSLTPESLKKLKLKFVIILDHLHHRFSICLSGQNKSIRKTYWKLFKGSDWNTYHLAESIDNNLMIIDHKLVENADFSDTKTLTLLIEKQSIQFMNDLREVLE